jgi:hypothetical protein
VTIFTREELIAIKNALRVATDQTPTGLVPRRAVVSALEKIEEAVQFDVQLGVLDLAWIPFISSDPLPTDELLLVTNNLNAKTEFGSMSHIWLVRGVFRLLSGEVNAVAEGIRLRKLTHYRKVVV